MHSSLQLAQVPPATFETDLPSIDLARQFFANPYGPHAPALQHLLNRMRAAPVAGKLVLLVVVPYCEWRLARLPACRGGAIEVLPGPTFTVPAEAECAAFRIRWTELFGEGPHGG